ncbi:hypothetical protein V8B97DRAFT_2004663 [Scleroderma yunnanense]
MKSLTGYYQGNKTRVGVKTVRRHPARPTLKSLTCCPWNRTRVGVKTVRNNQIIHSLSSNTP